MFIIYNLLITIIIFFIPIISLFVPKLKERNNRYNKGWRNSKFVKNKNTIWFHSASMGEFEQAKPLIEMIKKNNPDVQILCSFFSPSGYNTQKNYKFADEICYLPIDTYWNANKFINEINPTVAVFVRYELWYNYLFILKKKNVKTYLINATYPNILKKIKIFLPFYKSIFQLFSEIYAVSETDFELFNALKIKTTIRKSSDTRNDRILEKKNEAKLNSVLDKNLFFDYELLLVCGSVWNEDVDIIFDAISRYNLLNKKKIRLILVPHEPTESHISYIQSKFSNNILLSQILKKENHSNEKIALNKMIIVDSIGSLLKLYGIADLSYIGGAFGVGVHSVTEPAGYGIPLVTGANCYNSPDTFPLINCGALTKIENELQLREWLIYMNDNSIRAKTGAAAFKYIQANTGATQEIYINLKKIM